MNDRFFLCYFETTRRCNLHCNYCMSRPSEPPLRDELTTQEARHLVLEELARVSANVAVAFSGGEHLLRPDAYELLAHAGELGMWSFVNTNGRLLLDTDAISRALDATGGRVIFALPLNSVDGEVNEATRDDDPSRVLRAAERCEQEGAEHFFLLTISRQNMGTLGVTLEHLSETTSPVLRSPFVPRGAGRHFEELGFDRREMREVIHPALTAYPGCYVSFTPFFASPEAMGELWEEFDIRLEGLGCQAGRSFAAVNAEGDVAPCVQVLDTDCVRGNVRDQPLSEIITRDPLFEALRSREELGGRCGRCRYLDTCGGCRALAYYRNGDVLAEDPTCFFEPEDRSTVSELEQAQTHGTAQFVFYIKSTEPWRLLF